jgi:hypothetical protein
VDFLTIRLTWKISSIIELPTPSSSTTSNVFGNFTSTIYYVGVGMDGYLYTGNDSTLSSASGWNLFNTRGTVKHVIQLNNNGGYLGIELDNNLWKLDSLYGNLYWSSYRVLVFKGLLQLTDGNIIGVGLDNYLYKLNSGGDGINTIF